METNKKADLTFNDRSYVASDNIWKAYVEKSDLAARSWSKNWGFYIENKYTKNVLSAENESTEQKQNFKSMPKTESGLIGWKSTNEKFKLEKYGSNAKARGNFLKSLKWPHEAVI